MALGGRVRKLRYELACSEPETEDMHSLLTRRLNPMLFDLANRTGLLAPRQTFPRVMREWSNEEDGAHVEIVRTYDERTLEGMMVETLFNLRDNFIARRMNLNAFRRQVADLVLLASYRGMSIAHDLMGILLALGCSMHLSPIQTVSVEEELQILDKMRLMSNVKPEDMVKVELLALSWGRGMPRYPLTIRVTSPQGGEALTVEHMVTTDDGGRAVVSIPKYSVLEITAPNKVLELTYEILGVSEGPGEANPRNKTVKLLVSDRGMRVVLKVRKIPLFVYVALVALATLLLMVVAGRI